MSVKYRGVDGFWLGVEETNQVPRPVMMSLLGRVHPKNAGERERVVRFLMDAGWYPEAKEELDRLSKDFPQSDLSERAAARRGFIVQAEASHRRAEIDVRRKSQQYRAVSRLLKTFGDKAIGTEIQVEIREIERHEAQQQAADKALATELRQLSGRLSNDARAPWQKRLVEVLKAIDEAPDAVRGRFAAWQKAKADASMNDEARFALAMSGYVVGHDAAVADLALADSLWQARDAVRNYLIGAEPADRSAQAARLEGLTWPDSPDTPEAIRRLELITRIIQLMPPPRHEATTVAEKTALHRVLEDENAQPTEYAVWLPPEYHPLRRYPAVIVLHSGQGPGPAIDEWAAEASRHGYILIAPEYNIPGQPHDYRYTDQRACGRRARLARRPQTLRDRQRPRLRRRPAHRREHGLGLCPGAPGPVRGRHRPVGSPGQICVQVPASPRAAAFVVCHRRAGPRGQRVHLHQAHQADDPEDLGYHLHRVPAPRPRDIPRGDPPLRLDGQAPSRRQSEVVPGLLARALR